MTYEWPCTLLRKPYRCVATRSTSRCWRPGRRWRRRATMCWAPRSWTCLIKPCVQTLWGRKTRRTAGWRSPTPALLWSRRWLLPQWSKSDATSLKDGRIAGLSSLEGIKRSERYSLLRDCWRHSRFFFSFWKHWTQKQGRHQSQIWNLSRPVVLFFGIFILCTFSEI